MSSDVSIIEVRRRDPGPSPLSRHVAAPQSIILEKNNLDKVQTCGSKTTVTFFQEAQCVAHFLVENASVPLHVEHGHDWE
jgi:hypothetical protein